MGFSIIMTKVLLNCCGPMCMGEGLRLGKQQHHRSNSITAVAALI